jgi:hypothetical protein
MPNPARYDTGVVISMPFRIHNELALDMVRTFTSVAAIDMDGDCGSNVSVTDSCIEFLTDEETTTSILASSYDSVSFAWETDFPGTYRVKVFADNKDILDEDVENNNATPWVSFTVVEDLSCIPGDSGCNECSPGDPGCTGSCDPTVDTNCPPPDQDVYITATPTVIRKGATVTIGWDITDRDPATCKVLINDSVALKSPVPSKTGTVTDAPTQRTQYKLDCAADGSYVRSQDTVDVNVLPSLYES